MNEPNKTEEVLTGGERLIVTKRGDVVYRPGAPWSPTVHALLKHLEKMNFSAAPRVVGSGFDENGREMLTYIEGNFVHPGPWRNEAFSLIGRMLRDLHAATASFNVPTNAQWRQWYGRALGTSDRVVGHCDTGPWNIVARDGLPVALIDWEFAGPVDSTYELAQACWLNAQLYDDDVAERQGLPPAKQRARQMRWLLDGYGLTAKQRKGFSDKLIEFAIHAAANEAIESKVTPDTTDVAPLWAIAWRSRSAAWMLRNRTLLDNAL